MDWNIKGLACSSSDFDGFEIQSILIDVDGPRLFSAQTRVCTALFMLVDENESSMRFVVVPTDDRMLAKLESGSLTVRAALDQPLLWVLETSHSFCPKNAWRTTLAELPESILPQKGRMLRAHLQPAFRLRAIGEGLSAGTVPASVIRQVVEGASTAYNGEARELHTEDHALLFFEQYMDSRVSEGLYLSNQSWYRGSDPQSQFFLNDRGEPYKLSPRKKDSTDYQARAMSAKLKSFIEKAGIEGVTVSTYRDSFVKAMYDAGCHYKDLMRASGIKQKETIDRKTRPAIQDLDKVFKAIYSRVKVNN